ncbi:hypothetical protein SCATT_p00910 (plasmid) [Streptantibioticus cattleyicolor NRRL 8057 = DSM 46488]|uniref:Uncharacterized protein n=1 Tax=Streptantibioticus cattleyicolor (strain ATCC 35852 / DSM 46488 / JCM 4925 / NBRC 14057 / NRRL 8057) TaxID=1003195 RepID=G8XE19_STREN|nr:hypothetical protein SCATT_p00910 [Streptantibioticus cattleyicolor NRRL 8057 = DSM 46488]
MRRHADCLSLVTTASGHPPALSGRRQPEFGERAACEPAPDGLP